MTAQWTIQNFQQDIARLEGRIQSGDTIFVINGRNVDCRSTMEQAIVMHRNAIAEIEEANTITI